MTEVLQRVMNGLLLGGFYALLGVGMSMIFGIVGLTNLAHGELVILGAFASTALSEALGVHPLLTLLITVPLMFLLGAGLQGLLLNPIMKKGDEPALLVTFGLSIILQDALLLLFTADARHISTEWSVKALHVGGIDLSLLNLLLFGISGLCLLVLHVFLTCTHTGRAIRAVSDDREAAALSGIRPDRIYRIAMGIAMATAAVAGLCVGLKWTFYPSSGGGYLLISFIMVVIGGMGSIPGTFLAGLLFGLAQVIGGANYGLMISYLLLLLVLVLRPEGLFGKKEG